MDYFIFEVEGGALGNFVWWRVFFLLPFGGCARIFFRPFSVFIFINVSRKMSISWGMPIHVWKRKWYRVPQAPLSPQKQQQWQNGQYQTLFVCFRLSQFGHRNRGIVLGRLSAKAWASSSFFFFFRQTTGQGYVGGYIKVLGLRIQKKKERESFGSSW